MNEPFGTFGLGARRVRDQIATGRLVELSGYVTS
jgi:hypothetical protein